MKIWLSSVFFALSWGLLTSCAALSRMGDAAVELDSQGRPCFSVEGAAPSRLVESMSVAERASPIKSPRVVWSFMIDPPSGKGVPLSQGCIPYGQTPKGMSQLVDASPLKLGTIYSVSIGMKPVDAYDSTQGNFAEFCLLPGTPNPRIQLIQWDEKAGRRRYELCDAK